MASGMHGFATRSGKGGRSSPRPGSSRANAAALKVAVKPTILRDEPAQQHTGVRRQPLNNGSNAASQANHGQRRGSGETIHGRHDPFGTDAGSSIDTTVNERSITKGEEARQFQQQHLAYNTGDGEDDDYYDNGEHSGAEESDDRDDSQMEEEEDLFHKEARQIVLERVFGEGNSYPSTTSGPPDELFNQSHVGHQLPIDSVEHDDPVDSNPQQVANGHAARQAQPPFQRTHYTPAAVTTMPGPSIHQRAAAVRATDQRANTNLNVRGVGGHQTNVALHQNPTAAIQVPQHGVRPPSVPSPAPPIKRIQVTPAASVLVARPAQFQPQTESKEEPIMHYRYIEEDPVQEPDGPAEDYDTPALFDLSYDQLRDEAFDTEPRGKNEVLSNDMQKRELTERLVHVQKNLNAGDQDKFFRALPTHEWEEAGDWFLDQFSEIIKRAKEARQHKRKLAREFEDEVEKRYRYVAKRQQNVEAELEGMRTKGQALIPKSPRASKEPESKIPRTRKR